MDTESIGARIRNARTQLRLSIETLSELLNISPSYMSAIERGNRQGTVSTLIKIAKILDVSFEYIILGEKEMAVEDDFRIFLSSYTLHEIDFVKRLLICLKPYGYAQCQLDLLLDIILAHIKFARMNK